MKLEDDPMFSALVADGRWAQLVKALEERAQTLGDPQRRADLFEHAMMIYRDRFANAALAIKAAEGALAADPDREAAVAYLRDAYQKRRQFDKVAALDARYPAKR